MAEGNSSNTTSNPSHLLVSHPAFESLPPGAKDKLIEYFQDTERSGGGIINRTDDVRKDCLIIQFSEELGKRTSSSN